MSDRYVFAADDPRFRVVTFEYGWEAKAFRIVYGDGTWAMLSDIEVAAFSAVNGGLHSRSELIRALARTSRLVSLA